jgi:hypothetical protein
MKRRELLRGALAAGLTGPTLTTLTDTRTSFDRTLTAAPADLSDLEAAAESYGYGYYGQAPTRVRLCRNAGQMAGMTAIVRGSGFRCASRAQRSARHPHAACPAAGPHPARRRPHRHRAPGEARRTAGSAGRGGSRQSGVMWDAIGKALGSTRQAAFQRFARYLPK